MRWLHRCRLRAMARLWRWISHASTLAWLWSIAGTLVATPFAIAAALWADLPRWAVPFAAASTGALTLALGVTFGPYIVSRARRVRNAPRVNADLRFYPDRAAMIQATGGLLREAQGARIVWLATLVGNHADVNGLFDLPQFRRLVLIHPRGQHLPTLARQSSQSETLLRESIEGASRAATAHGVEVRWFDGPILNMVLLDPDEVSGSVRFEVLVPFRSTRPGYRAERGDPLFFEMRAAFDRLWEASVPAGDPPDPDLVTLVNARLMPAWEAAMAVMSPIRSAVRSRYGEAVWALFQMGVFDQIDPARQAVKERIASERSGNLDPLVAAMYEKYEMMVRWIDGAGGMVDQPYADSRRFRDWIDEDARLIERLRDLVAEPSRASSALTEARRKIEEGGVAKVVRQRLAERPLSGRDGGIA